MMYSKYIPKILSLALIVFLSGAFVAHAYVPLAKLPIGDTATGSTGYESMGAYLAGMIKFLIAIGGVIAIVTAIIGGVQYIASGITPSGKEAAKKRIGDALVGLALILTSYLILNSINPDLVKLNLDLKVIEGEKRKHVSTVTKGDGWQEIATDALLMSADSAEPTTPTDPIIESLSLTARVAALKLKTLCPSVQFESGKRDPSRQATAMANNIASTGDRRWIEKTYTTSTAITKLQKWVDTNPSATSASVIQQGLFITMMNMPDSERALVSKHLSGSAFDVAKVSGVCALNTLRTRSLPGMTKFIENEAGVSVWHAEF